MIDSKTVQKLLEGCRIDEFTRRIANEVLDSTPVQPTREQLNDALLQLQELFQEYRKTNQCKGWHLVPGHDCIYEVYCAAFDRLKERVVVKPKRQKKPSMPEIKPRLTIEEQIGNILEEIQHARENQE